MKYAINYSTQAALLLSQNHLKIDRFKCPDWPEMIAEALGHCQVAVHFNLFAGRGKLHKVDFDQIEKLADLTKTPYINLHLEAKRNDFPGYALDTKEPSQIRKIYRKMVSEVMLAVDRFGSQRVIIENVPYRPMGNIFRAATEPELIYRMIDETGCGLLLDLSHASITASSYGISTAQYVEQLPVESIKEMHFTGVMNLGGWLQDHLPAEEKDWRELNWAIEQIKDGKWAKPWMLAFEYGGVGEKFAWRSSAQVIESQSARICSLLSSL